MAVNSITGFLTDYIGALPERTRVEKGAIKTGFDWVIYQLGIAKKWSPFQLPFFRRPDKPTGKSKDGKPQFGEDISFLSPSKREYYIFVLKDEELTYKNWTRYNFLSDLQLAATPNLKRQGLEKVKSVKVILAYNKDEENDGVQTYDNLVATLGSRIGNKIKLSFERWNLTKIGEEIQTHLLSPELLPQHLAGQFQYICSQFNDFDYGTKEWRDQLLPHWRNFLKVALEEPVDEKKVRLIPLALIILNNYRKSTPNSYPAWIDMIEWAMLVLWARYKNAPSQKRKKVNILIVQIWIDFYITELEKYFLTIEPVLTTQHAFSAKKRGVGFGVSPINDAYLAYWHIGRLGVLTLAPQDFQIRQKAESGKSPYKEFIQNLVVRSADWLVKCLHSNPAALRPLLDLNHIEIFLIWAILFQAGRIQDIYGWLSTLEGRLLMRRAKMNIKIPFIESNSQIDLVAEYAATGKRPYNYSDNSSYLLLMILELCFSLPDDQRDELLKRYMNRIVKGRGDEGKSFEEGEIDLQSWIPPEDWSGRIWERPVWEGIAITTGNFEKLSEKETPLSERIRKFVEETRQKHPWKIPDNTPLAVYILACIKHHSPLPPEFWRGTVFPVESNVGTSK
ncbi:MAG: hypothetical protein WC454_05635 [Phycisphaerae bacterium]|jgi:hypothetical protein